MLVEIKDTRLVSVSGITIMDVIGIMGEIRMVVDLIRTRTTT